MLKPANLATSLLASPIDDADTTLDLTSGDEGRFPSLTPGEWFPVTVVDNAGNREVMRCTARSGVTLTVTRAQEGTTAKDFAAGARVDLRLTAGALTEALADAGRLSTGFVPETVIRDGLKAEAAAVADADAVTATGIYRTTGATTGTPTTDPAYLVHFEGTSGTAYQEWRQIGAATARGRHRAASVWGAWATIHIAESTLDARFVGKAGGAMTGKLETAASSTGGAGFSLPAGSAPTSPANGDFWATATGLFWRVAGATWALARLASNVFTGKQTFAASTTGEASINLPAGTAPTSPVNGDIWATTAALFARINGVTHEVATKQQAQDLAAWQAGSSTTETVTTPAKVKAAIEALAPVKMYTGDNAVLTDYPIGTTIIVHLTTNVLNNAIVVPQISADNSYFVNTGVGEVLVGTWRSRGRTGYGWVFLAQRVG